MKNLEPLQMEATQRTPLPAPVGSWLMEILTGANKVHRRVGIVEEEK